MALTSQIIGYWKLDGNNTDQVNAIGASDTNITYGNSYGKLNQGALFNGSSSKIEVSNSTFFNTNAFSIQAWVYSTDYSQNMSIFWKGAVNTQYGFFFEGGYIKLRIIYGGGLSEDFIVTLATAGISNSNWYHVVATYDGTTFNIYVNGSSVGSKIQARTIDVNNTGMHIGSYGTGYYWNGNLDEIGVWSRALSSSEAGLLYNGGAGLAYPLTPLILTASRGQFSLTGYNASLSLAGSIIVNTGTFNLTGNKATMLWFPMTMSVSTGAFSMSGLPINTKIANATTNYRPSIRIGTTLTPSLKGVNGGKINLNYKNNKQPGLKT
jgi:hypothetical protein